MWYKDMQLTLAHRFACRRRWVTMKRWLLLSLIPIGVLLFAAGALLLQSADEAEANIASGDSLSYSPSGGSGDALIVAPDSAGSSLATTDTPALSDQCYFAGIARFPCYAPGWDLYALRYLWLQPRERLVLRELPLLHAGIER
jgi:hypothetical protein